MGLDTVELIMAMEEEFGITIPNEDAAKLAKLGQLHEYIISALRKRGEFPDEALVWNRLAAVVVRQLGVRPDEITKSAHIVYDLRAD